MRTSLLLSCLLAFTLSLSLPFSAFSHPLTPASESKKQKDKKKKKFTPQTPVRPIVLLLPGGAWQHADREDMQPWLDDFHAHGTRARILTYRLRDVPGAIEDVRAEVAKEKGPVILYGVSAGGTLAAALAARGEVAGAVNVVGPTDLTRWINPGGHLILRRAGLNSQAQRRAVSPYWRLNGRQSPQLLQCGALDSLVTGDQCLRYGHAAKRAQPDISVQLMVNAHTQSHSDRTRARAWIQARWGK